MEVAKRLNQQGNDCFRILFPKGMDANEYALKMTPPQKSLALVIRKEEWMGSNFEGTSGTSVKLQAHLVGVQLRIQSGLIS